MVLPKIPAAADHIHHLDVVQRARWLQKWQRFRHGRFRMMFECAAEFFGVFFYVYCGVGATMAYNVGLLTKNDSIGSLFTVGLAYALGVVFAVAICAPVAGGHFNPCITIAKAVWHDFPWKKVPSYIISQILGAYLACISVYMQYRMSIALLEASLMESGQYDAIWFTPSGIAGVFGLSLQPGGNPIAASMNEFSADFFLGLVIWAILDPSNYFIPPVAVPWIVGLAYGVAIWDFAPNGLAANSARDVGGRLMAMTIWGKRASGGPYAVVAALTNIPATLFASLIYELVFTDSSRVIPPAQLQFLFGHKAYLEHGAMGPHEQVHVDVRSQNSADKNDKTEVHPAQQSTYSV